MPDDVRQLMYKVKHAQGVDIPRIFCGLNDVRNIIPSIKWAAEAGMTPQATLCITSSPIHTVDYYSDIADKLIAAGAPEICLKDMANRSTGNVGRAHQENQGKASRCHHTVSRTLRSGTLDGFHLGGM